VCVYLMVHLLVVPRLYSILLYFVGVNRPWRDEWMIGWMDGWMKWWFTMSFILPVTSHLYSTLSSPRQSKQTMTKLMDDQTNGWMNDETDGWNDASWCSLLCLSRHLYILLFFRLVIVNKTWQDTWMTEGMDGWMTGQMDEMMFHDVLYYM